MQTKELLRQYKYYFLGALVGIVLLSIIFFVLLSPAEKNELEYSFQKEALTDTSGDASQVGEPQKMTVEKDSEVFVDLKGAVKNPGMYQAQGKMRVWDVVELAGGVKENADTKQVNFSQRVSDQMIIYVPIMGEILPDTIDGTASLQSQRDAGESAKVDLNKASESELQTLTGIGHKKAQDIIRYRTENGNFKSIEELTNISGIGEKTIEKLKAQIIVS